MANNDMWQIKKPQCLRVISLTFFPKSDLVNFSYQVSLQTAASSAHSLCGQQDRLCSSHSQPQLHVGTQSNCCCPWPAWELVRLQGRTLGGDNWQPQMWLREQPAVAAAAGWEQCGAGHSTGVRRWQRLLQKALRSALLQPYLILYSLVCIKLNHIKAYY